MGHAVAATPLQIHEAMCAVANDGVLMRPQVVRRILDHDGGAYLDFEPIARRRVLSVRTARELARLLVAVVGRDGTAQAAEIPGFEIAGKTGTTQKIIDGVYSRDHHVATFSGFFPARDPRVAVTVVIDDAQLEGNAYGGRIAAPVFRNIAEELIQYLGVAPVGQSSLAAR